MKKQLTFAQSAVRSINKKFRKEIWSPFIKACKNYELVLEGDKIAVCISGGKDSMLLALLMTMLKNISKVNFELKFIVMDPGYNEKNRELIEENLKKLEIKAEIFNSDIFEAVSEIPSSPCYLCARMRRGHLYAKAQELGCNKIALGHHMSDVIETTFMAMMYGAQIQGMLPKLKSQNFPGMQLIRPLYMIKEDSIISWQNYNDLTFLRCACKFTEMANADEHESASKRKETKKIISELKKINPNIEENIFNSLHNVHADTFLEYKTDGLRHSFLERF